jgi:polar amino acid transport system substrate-binding protein
LIEVKKMKHFYAAILSLLFSTAALADTVFLTSLSWPPYSDKDLKDQGASVAVAKAAFEAMGHTLVVDFYPWSRAVKLASEGAGKYAGYFPEYSYDSNEFVFSAPMGQGPLGLVESKSKPIEWSNVADLAKYKIGVVQDYVNTEELDAKIAAGEIKAQTVTSDDINVQKVAGGRIDAAVIDSNVFNYLVNNEDKLKSFQGALQMNQQLLVVKDLHVAFRNDDTGKKWLDIYNQGLQKIDIKSLMDQYLK